MSIQRWRVTDRTEIPDYKGYWVRHSDHVAELSVLELKVQEAQSALAAERTRREEAEKVVDALDARDLDIFNLLSGYRAKYPRDPK